MKKTLREVAYDRFKDKLFNKEIALGAFVSQREISDLVGVPLGPTREALKRLEAEDFVRLIAQRGIQVRQVDYDLIRETHELRVILEIAALERFVAIAPDEEVAALISRTEEAASKVAHPAPSGEVLEEVRRADRKLHDSLIATMENSEITEVYDRTFAKIRLIRLNGKHLPKRSGQIMQEHLHVLWAIRDRNFLEAKAALMRHLNISHQRALGLPSQRGDV